MEEQHTCYTDVTSRCKGRDKSEDVQNFWNWPTPSNHFLCEGKLLMTEASTA